MTFRNMKKVTLNPETESRDKFVANYFDINVKENEELTLYKYVSVLSSLNNSNPSLAS